MRTKIGFIGDIGLENVESDCRFCVEHGFDGLEYNWWANFKDVTLDTVQAMHDIHRKHGVSCSMLGLWGWNHLAPDAEERQHAHDMLDRAIEFATVLEAEVLTTGSGTLGDVPLADNVAEFAQVFPPFLDRIESAGMRAAFYPLHGNTFLSGLEAYERIWETLPQVGIKYDPANWRHHGDDYLAVARKYGNKVTYLHIKEHLYHDGGLASQPAAGMGDIEWGKIFAFLYEHDCNCPLSIEPHGALWSKGEMRRKMLLLTQRHIAPFLV